jgi:Ca-activated chloride channel family protein
MTFPEHRETERRLREIGSPEPPPDLLESLVAEIPERPAVVAVDGESGGDPGRELPSPDRRPRRDRSRRPWLAAASVAIAVVGVWLALEVQRYAPERMSSVRAEAPTSADTRVSPQSRVERSPSELLPGVPQATETSGVPETPGEPPTSAGSPSAAEREEASGRELAAASRSEVGTAAGVPPPEPEERSLSDQRIEDFDSIGASPPTADAAQARQSGAVAEIVIPESPPLPAAPQPLSKGTVQREEKLASVRPRRLAESQQATMAAEPGPPQGALGYVSPSTGGTTEPNDQPFGDTFFRSYGVNPFIDTEDDNLSTFAMDVDTGSYTVVRAYLSAGHLPPPEAIRVEEMVNFFDYGDAPPAAGEGADFAIHLEGAPTPFGESAAYRLLRLGLRGREIDAADRRPATLIFVVDVSGSMDRESRLGLVKRSLGLLLDRLREDDRVGLVVYGSRGEVLLEPTGDLEAIRAAIERLTPGGSTNAEEGLALAYDLAERHLRAGAIHRIVLCSDGVANVGRTGPDSILGRIGASAERGIELTAVGFGMANYNDILMEQLADRGDGHYAYVDNLDEARRVFVENLTGTLQTIARDAKIQVELHPEAVSRYRLLGYENRDVADERFRDDGVDAGEVGAGHSVTALYEVKLLDGVDPGAPLATLRLRYQPAEGGAVVETSRTLRAGELARSWDEASPALRLASVVAELAEILRHSYWARESDPRDLLARAQAVSAEFPGDVDVAELVGLVGRASRLLRP